jgi:hypothetical protein
MQPSGPVVSWTWTSLMESGMMGVGVVVLSAGMAPDQGRAGRLDMSQVLSFVWRAV